MCSCPQDNIRCFCWKTWLGYGSLGRIYMFICVYDVVISMDFWWFKVGYITMRRWISATDISGLDRPLARLSDQCPSRISQSHIPRCLHNIYTIYVVYCILTEWVCMPIQTFFRWVRAQFWGIKLSLLARANRTQKKIKLRHWLS